MTDARLTIAVTTYTSGETVVYFDPSCCPACCNAKVIRSTRYFCLDPHHIMPASGFLTLSDFEGWRQDLMAQGVNFVECAETPPASKSKPHLNDQRHSKK